MTICRLAGLIASRRVGGGVARHDRSPGVVAALLNGPCGNQVIACFDELDSDAGKESDERS
jgi:hypothetical protein